MKIRLEMQAESVEDERKIEAALRAEDLLLAVNYILQKQEVSKEAKDMITKMLHNLELEHLLQRV